MTRTNDTPAAPRSRRARRRAIFAAIVVAFFAVATFLAAEIALRVHFAIKLRGRGLAELTERPADDPNRAIDIRDLMIADPDPDMVYKMRPRARGVFMGGPVELNDAGFRTPPVAETKPPGTLRVVALGDSHTFGWGVRDEECYARLLEGALNRLAGPDRKVEVVNLGIPGINAVQESRVFERYGEPLDPDLVMIQFELNDTLVPAVLLDADFSRLRPLFSVAFLKYGWARLRGKEVEARGDLMRAFPMFQDAVEGSPVDVPIEDVPPRYRHMLGWDALAGAYRRLSARCAELGVPLRMILPAHRLHEDLPAMRSDPAYDRARALAKELGIETIDTFGATRQIALARGVGTADLAIDYPNDIHPTPARHAMMARAILPRVAEALGVGTPEALDTEIATLDERIRELVDRGR